MKNFGILLLAMVSCCLLQAKDRVVKQGHSLNITKSAN